MVPPFAKRGGRGGAKRRRRGVPSLLRLRQRLHCVIDVRRRPHQDQNIACLQQQVASVASTISDVACRLTATTSTLAVVNTRDSLMTSSVNGPPSTTTTSPVANGNRLPSTSIADSTISRVPAPPKISSNSRRAAMSCTETTFVAPARSNFEAESGKFALATIFRSGAITRAVNTVINVAESGEAAQTRLAAFAIPACSNTSSCPASPCIATHPSSDASRTNDASVSITTTLAHPSQSATAPQPPTPCSRNPLLCDGPSTAATSPQYRVASSSIPADLISIAPPMSQMCTQTLRIR